MKIPPLILTILLSCTALQAQGQTPSANPPAMPDLSQPSVSPVSSIDPAKAAEIRKMLELTGTVKLTTQVLDQMIDTFKSQNSSVSADFWDRFEKQMNPQDLVDKMVPLYDKYYTLDDLKAINAFYESPAGQRVLANSPLIMRESMQIGQEWGRNVAAQLMDQLKKEKAAASASSGASPSSGN
jgi:hypothetical protein